MQIHRPILFFGQIHKSATIFLFKSESTFLENFVWYISFTARDVDNIIGFCANFFKKFRFSACFCDNSSNMLSNMDQSDPNFI